MNAFTNVGFVTALLLSAGSLHAQEVVAVPPGADQILPVKKGEASPIDGQVFSNDTALRWANWLVQYKNLVKADTELQKQLCAADIELQQKKVELERDQYKRVTEELQKKLLEAQTEAASPPFYQTATFGAVLGVLGTVAAVGATAAIVHAVR